MKVVNKHIFLYLSAAPQHAVADNSEMFEAGEGYDKDHRCGINNSNSSNINITGENNSGGSIMPYESLDTSPDTHQSQF